MMAAASSSSGNARRVGNLNIEMERGAWRSCFVLMFAGRGMLINVLPEQNMSMGKGTTARMHIQPPSLGRRSR